MTYHVILFLPVVRLCLYIELSAVDTVAVRAWSRSENKLNYVIRDANEEYVLLLLLLLIVNQ